jgi:hypothetical protein
VPPSLLLALALALALSTAARADLATPPSETQATISVDVRETTVFAVPPSATWLVSDEKVVEAVRTPSGLVLRGLRLGETLLFISDGPSTRVYTVSVVPAAPTSTFSAGPNPADLLERRLSLLTGGIVERAAIGLSDTLDSTRGVYSRALFASLSGLTPALSYSFNASGQQYQGHVQSIDVNGTASGGWGHADFSTGQEFTEFKPVLWGGIYRQANVVFTPGAWDLGLSARAPYRFDRPSFDPQGYRGFVSHRWDAGPVATVGFLEGGLAATPTTLPFAGVGFESGRAGLMAFAGRTATGAAEIGAAKAHLSLGPCLVTASFTTGLRGPDAASLRDAFVAFVDPGVNSFRSNGQCHFGEVTLGGGAYRGGIPNALASVTSVIASGFLSWDGGPQGSAYLNVQWSANGQDSRNYASFNTTRRYGSFELSASALASHPGDQWSFNESETLRRYFGLSSLGLSGGLSHAIGPPQSVWGSVDLSIETGWLRASAGYQLSKNLIFVSAPFSQIVGQLELRPARAYTLRAYTSVDPRHVDRWNFNAGVIYSFGDALPREPLLWALRTSRVEAVAFEDRNGNGVRDPGEPALAGVRVCVDHGQCGPTNAEGRWSASGLKDGVHDVVADASALAGIVPTSSPIGSPLVGTYRTPRLAFGFRYQADLVVRAFLDRNGNGKRDPDDTEFKTGTVSLQGAGLEVVEMSLADARVQVFEKGSVQIRLDPGSMPPGFGPGREVVTAEVQTFSRIEIDVPVRPLRALGGRICLDENGDENCQPSERGAGLVRVTNGKDEVTADEQGNFLFSDLAPGEYHLRVREEDLPGGTVQVHSVDITIGNGPMVATSLMLPLKLKLFAQRSFSVLLARPSGGPPSAAREIGGLFLRATDLAAGAAKSQEHHKNLLRLVRASRRKPSLVLVLSYCDAAHWEKNQQEAEREAREAGDALVKSLHLDATQATVEVRSPTADEAVLDVRVYNWQ